MGLLVQAASRKTIYVETMDWDDGSRLASNYKFVMFRRSIIIQLIC